MPYIRLWVFEPFLILRVNGETQYWRARQDKNLESSGIFVGSLIEEEGELAVACLTDRMSRWRYITLLLDPKSAESTTEEGGIRSDNK